MTCSEKLKPTEKAADPRTLTYSNTYKVAVNKNGTTALSDLPGLKSNTQITAQEDSS